MATDVRRARKPRPRCIECGKVSYRAHPILEIYLCAPCRRATPEKYQYVTKTRAMGEFRLSGADLNCLGVHEVNNPHYKKAAPMRLYLLTQVRDLSQRKWGSAEPYVVELVQFSDERWAWFLEDPERLKKLPEDRFEHMIAALLNRWGFEVQRVGPTHRKDGGVDIIAWPGRKFPFPFLMAVQVKHHRATRKTGAPAVREFHGAVSSGNSTFNMGMIVTNTTFTADAKWFAENNKTFLRLRDIEDLQRWMKEDFQNEHEWREIPDQIELAPGVSIDIPKRSLWLP